MPFQWISQTEGEIDSARGFSYPFKIEDIKLEAMLPDDCERDIQLEFNKNYLKSFPARLKFCHVVSNLRTVMYYIRMIHSEWLMYVLMWVTFLFQFLGILSSGLLLYFTSYYYLVTFMPIATGFLLALGSLIFLVSSTITWKTNGKIRMAQFNFVSE